MHLLTSMRKNLRHIVLLTATVCLMTGICTPIKANAFESKTVKVGYYENEIFQEGAAEGEIKSGYSYDYLQKVASITGWRYEYVYGTWTELYAAFIHGDIDLLAGLGYDESRVPLMNYPNYPMGNDNYYLFIRSDNEEITLNPATLQGKKIGCISGLLETTLSTWLSDRGIRAQIVVFDEVTTINTALASGSIDASIGESSFISTKSDIKPLTKINSADFYLCVVKERTDLLDELNNALAEIDNTEPFYINDISKKYYSDSLESIFLNDSELQWLKDKNNTIRVGYLNDFLPYSGSDKNGNALGVLVDSLEVGISNLKIEHNITIEYYGYETSEDMIDAITNHQLDLIFPVSDNLYFLEQRNLLRSNPVIDSSVNLVYKGSYDVAMDGALAICGSNLVTYEYAITNFPDKEIVSYDTVQDCLDAVTNGDVGTTLLSGFRINTFLTPYKYRELSYSEAPTDSILCYAVCSHNTPLLAFVNRAIGTLSNADTTSYIYNYLNRNTEYTLMDFARMYSLEVSILVLIFLIIIIACIAGMVVRSRTSKLYYKNAYFDGLTSMPNRRAYEEDLLKLKKMPDNIICLSMDINGLKHVNDNFGHVAGDELIIEAGRIADEVLGKYGKIYRIGGDEYSAILYTDKKSYKEASITFENACSEWNGKYSDSLNVSVGAAFKDDMEEPDIVELFKIADKRMYDAKRQYYINSGMDRRV